MTNLVTIRRMKHRHTRFPKRLDALVRESGKVMNDADVDTLWYQTNPDVFLNRWYSTYADARAARDSDGGFLLPYKRHFFVCEAEVIARWAWSRMIPLGKDNSD